MLNSPRQMGKCAVWVPPANTELAARHVSTSIKWMEIRYSWLQWHKMKHCDIYLQISSESHEIVQIHSCIDKKSLICQNKVSESLFACVLVDLITSGVHQFTPGINILLSYDGISFPCSVCKQTLHHQDQQPQCSGYGERNDFMSKICWI